MSLWFCQKCKCTSDFEECEGCGGPADELLFIPRSELEELVGALELSGEIISYHCSAFWPASHPSKVAGREATETAAKFHAKYLEGK